MKSKKKLYAIIFINLIIFALLFALIETVFRFTNFPFKAEWTPPENALGRFDDTLGWSYLPDTSKTIEFNGKSRDICFDKDGIRVPNSEYQFDYSKPTVLFIGGSFTMGHGLAYEDSFAGKFDNLKEVNYQVVNLGVQGFGSDQALLALRKFLLKFNTKVVVYTFISSHVKRNGNYDRRLIWPGARFIGTKPLFGLKSGNKLYLKKEPVLYKDYTHSYLIDFLKMRVGNMLGVFPPKRKKLTKAIIQEMKNYSEDHGAHFVAINWRWRKKRYNYVDLFEGVNMISTLENMPVGWHEMRLPNDDHPDERASDHIVQLLVNYFRKNNLM